MRVHFIIHDYFEAPGAYEYWARKNKFNVTFTRLYEGDKLPDSVSGIDFLIVMGGPQSPATTTAECSYFDSKKEQAFIASAIAANKAVIGVCLGAQLIGEALGAPYEQSPDKEIGKFTMHITNAGKRSQLFSNFGDSLGVGHWHNDMPGLTENAQIIAFSAGCPRQIVAYSNQVFGFQCHMEFTRDVVEYLILNSEDDLKSASNYRFVDTPSAIRRHSYSEMNEKLIEFLDKLAQGYTISRSNKTEKTEEKKVHRPMAKTKKRRSIHPVTGL